MIQQDREKIKRHIKTHTERSSEDRAAIALLGSFLNPGGKINTSFAANDTWPNHDGTFEFVLNPDVSRYPIQNFIVQIKGTNSYTENDNGIKYSLKSLAFPAYICDKVSLDPGILFVVLNPDQRGKQRVFWKYMSADFLNSINFDHNSMTLSFTSDEEILNTDESVAVFCKKLELITNHHSFINQLDSRGYTRHDVEKIIDACNTEIKESINRLDINDTRDGISRRILRKLDDLCKSVLLLSAMDDGIDTPTLPLAWERSMLNIETKYLGSFFRGLQYIGMRIPDDGQSERLMLKYYDFMWQIRKSLHEKYGLNILENLEKFPLHVDQIDQQYYETVASAVEKVGYDRCALRSSRYYVQKIKPFFIGKERYYEITLQLAGVYASKYNRITAYSKKYISTSYTVKIGYEVVSLNLWGIDTNIKVITDWRVSIDPVCLNKLAKVLKITTRISSKYGEYERLMDFLTQTGLNFLELIDFQEIEFSEIIDSIYRNTNTSVYKNVLIFLRKHYSKTSKEIGRNVVRYLLLNLREETLNSVMPTQYNTKLLSNNLYLSRSCFPFERNPFISNLKGCKTGVNSQVKRLISVAGSDNFYSVRPYLYIRDAIKQTGEIYFDTRGEFNVKSTVEEYNRRLNDWEREQGYEISITDDLLYINSYEQTTLFILEKLLEFSNTGNKGQREYNLEFLKNRSLDSADEMKKSAIKDIFVNSRLLLIYGAAGTGKTTLINYISNLMTNQKKLFLTKTHTALQNLKRRIENPGTNSDFISIDSFIKKVEISDYDIIFMDECSTIDNRTMKNFLNQVGLDTFLVLAGDIYQIESIEFGNWFFYAKDIIKNQGSNIELLNTWRTKDQNLISLWNEVRNRSDMIIEQLVINGPYSEDIGPSIFERKSSDEVILCLNYDGKFGLNNMNNYFQAANTKGKTVSWAEWTYKEGDPILFNDSKRFKYLYNNLKGHIVSIEKFSDSISFTVDVDIPLTEVACKKDDIEFIDTVDNGTRIRFEVYQYNDQEKEENEDFRLKTIVPFQLAYAVSIHKAQGLEYDSVKIIIPDNTGEKITHGIFYTAITRAKRNLKIYWSSETMQDVVKGFVKNDLKKKSLEIVKLKLAGE